MARSVGRNQDNSKWWYPLTWIAFPLAYLVYFLAGGIYESLYSFLDPEGDEFAGMIAGLLAGVIVTGYLLYGAGKLKGAIRGGGKPAYAGPPYQHGYPAR